MQVAPHRERLTTFCTAEIAALYEAVGFRRPRQTVLHLSGADRGGA